MPRLQLWRAMCTRQGRFLEFTVKFAVALATLSLLAGCSVGDDGAARSPFGQPAAEWDDRDDAGDLNDPPSPTDDDDDDDNNGTGGDDDDAAEGWDALPPEAGDGSTLTLILTCGLLDGPHENLYEKTGDRWHQVEGSGNGVFEWADPCMTRTEDKYLTWNEAPALYLTAGGLDHDLSPTTTQDRWFGDVTSQRESSRECVDNLAERGLSFPVAITIEVIDINLAD